jgi:hypothetical protein
MPTKEEIQASATAAKEAVAEAYGQLIDTVEAEAEFWRDHVKSPLSELTEDAASSAESDAVDFLAEAGVEVV